MPTYCFHCASADHPDGEPRDFEVAIHHVPTKVIQQYKCRCGGLAKRDLAKEIPTIGQVGLTPIRPSDSKHSIGNELQCAFGKFKVNPDGSQDTNHAPFRDTGELARYMDGGNDIGEPVIKDNGQPLRRPDGSIVRRGAKLFKYGPNATPSRDGIGRRFTVPDAWTDVRGVKDASGVVKTMQNLPVYRNPERRAK